MAEAAADVEDDLNVVAGVARRVQGLARALNAPLAVGDGAFALAPRGRAGQHHVGQLRRLGEEDVLHHEVVETLQEVHGVLLVRLGLRGVLTDDVHGAQVATLHRLEHLREVPAVTILDGDAPRRAELLAHRRIEDVLETCEPVGDGAHVATALHVVLPAQWIEAGAVTTDVTTQQRQVDQRQHVVDGVVVLGDAQRPAHLGAVGASVRVRELDDCLDGYAGDLAATDEGPLLDRRGIRLEAGGGPIDEVAVDQTRMDDLTGNRVAEGDVGADVVAEPEVSPLGRRRTARVDHEQLGAVVDTLQDVMEEDRVRIASIAAPQHDDIGVFDFGIAGRAAACSEHCGQTDHRGSVSSSVAGVDVVGTDSDSGELVGDEVHLVGRLRTGEHANRVRAVAVAGRGEASGRTIERLGPRRGPQHAVLAHERLGDARHRGETVVGRASW